MAAIIRNQSVNRCVGLLNEEQSYTKFQSRSDLKLRLFKEVAAARTSRTKKNNKMSSNMRSLPGLKSWH